MISFEMNALRSLSLQLFSPLRESYLLNKQPSVLHLSAETKAVNDKLTKRVAYDVHVL